MARRAAIPKETWGKPASWLLCYPFSAIVGQDDMKLAFVIAAIDPSIGGVLVFGDRGTGKVDRRARAGGAAAENPGGRRLRL